MDEQPDLRSKLVDEIALTVEIELALETIRQKHYIDLLTQPGLSFCFDPQTGYTPLLKPRPVVAIAGRHLGAGQGGKRGFVFPAPCRPPILARTLLHRSRTTWTRLKT